jgi:ATP-binding cassette subfamily C protein PrsD
MVVLRTLGIGLILAVAVGTIFALTHTADTLDLTATRLAEVWASARSAWDPWLLTLLGLSLLIGGQMCLDLFRITRRRRATAEMKPGNETPSSKASSHQSAPQLSPRSELARALSSIRSACLSVGLFSGMINMLMLTGAFFMLQIYDRVLPSRSVPTLVALAILVAVLFAFLAILDMIRGRMLVRIGASLDDALSARVYDAIVRLPLRVGNRGDGLQPLHDLDTVRGFLSGPGPNALFDLPWMPLYIGIVAAFHIALGIAATIGAIILITLTLMTEALARRPMRTATDFAQTRNVLAEASRRNAEVLRGLGMARHMNARWSEANQSYLASNQRASDVAGGFGSVSRALRMLLQSAVLGIGAYLVISQAATAGIMIAAAILVARALAPVDQAIANWKGFVAARQSWKRLRKLFEMLPASETPLALPAPTASLVVEHATAVPSGEKKVVVYDVSFKLESGQGLGIIGPSASGKSSLLRLIVGAWHPVGGKIRLDGAALDQWCPEALGQHIGYLPQDVELFAGTVAENIARFEPEATSEDIIEAARAAGVHELILGLPQGYETEIGEQGEILSAGQRQRIALARALYRAPFLVVLDEPNSNLDSEGEAALIQAILGVRDRGGIFIVVAHRPSALAGVDFVLVMANGKAVSFGPKDKVLPKVLPPAVVSRGPLTLVTEAGQKP